MSVVLQFQIQLASMVWLNTFSHIVQGWRSDFSLLLYVLLLSPHQAKDKFLKQNYFLTSVQSSAHNLGTFCLFSMLLTPTDLLASHLSHYYIFYLSCDKLPLKCFQNDA